MNAKTMTPQEFVDKWRRSRLTERFAAQSHFNDLCRILGYPLLIGARKVM